MKSDRGPGDPRQRVAPGLFRFLTSLGWPPRMRVTKGGRFRPTGWGRFYGLGQLRRQPGAALTVAGRADAGARMACTLLARGDEGHAEPWRLLTDLPPSVISDQ